MSCSERRKRPKSLGQRLCSPPAGTCCLQTSITPTRHWQHATHVEWTKPWSANTETTLKKKWYSCFVFVYLTLTELLHCEQQVCSVSTQLGEMETVGNVEFKTLDVQSNLIKQHFHQMWLNFNLLNLHFGVFSELVFSIKFFSLSSAVMVKQMKLTFKFSKHTKESRVSLFFGAKYVLTSLYELIKTM